MGHALKIHIAATVIASVSISERINSQLVVPDRSEREFYEYILTDTRTEPDAIVFNIVSNDYSGPLIDLSGSIGFYLTTADSTCSDTNLETVVDWLLSRKPLVFHKSYADCCQGVARPPATHKFYRYLKKNPKKLLKKYFLKDNNSDRYHMLRTLSQEDELALIVVLFEHKIPIYENDWGIWIDAHKEHLK
ncbi:MAG: hypothetical protein K1X54_11025 [Flavobacteriales bacterium]|nr:hypothetical protein [Flavobacteriales bacterium]